MSLDGCTCILIIRQLFFWKIFILVYDFYWCSQKVKVAYNIGINPLSNCITKQLISFYFSLLLYIYYMYRYLDLSFSRLFLKKSKQIFYFSPLLYSILSHHIKSSKPPASNLSRPTPVQKTFDMNGTLILW